MEDHEWWYFTIDEGENWIPFLVKDPNFSEKLLSQLRDQARWVHSPTKGQKSAISCIPGYLIKFVHSVQFPDGKIWDSTLRNFRDAKTSR